MARTLKRLKPVSKRRQDTLANLYQTAVTLILANRQADVQEIAGQMLAIDEAYAPAWDILASSLVSRGTATDAELAARRALSLNSRLLSASVALGAALLLQRRYQEAALHLGKGVDDFPESVPMWSNLAGALAALRHNARAEYCYRRVLELDPSNTNARVQLANVLCILARPDEAKVELAIAAETSSPILALRSAQFITALPDTDEQITAEREHFAAEVERLSATLEPVAELPDGFIGTNFYLAYHGRNDRDLQQSWTRLLLKICPFLDAIPHRKARQISSGERIRVGFISGHLKDRHTISKLTAGLMAKLPRNRFEVVAFDLSASTDPGYLPQFADRVVQCSALPTLAATEIEEAKLDVAFYPDIGMHPVANRVAFSRLAPVQCTTWGHPVTTGLPSIDYFLSSELLEPEGAEAHYSEELIRLSSLPTYYYRPQRMTGRMPSFPSDWNLYLCPQTLFKFSPQFDAVLAGILERDPNGRLLLIDNGGEYANKLGDRISSKHPGIIDRVVFLNRMSADEFIGLIQSAHVMLDTNPFGGGNTTYEAFAFGVPIVTLPGEFMRGRVTLGCYRKMGFEECVVSSPEEYVERAVRLANDRDYRQWVGHEILTRSGAIFHDQGAVDEIAAFFERAVEKAAKAGN